MDMLYDPYIDLKKGAVQFTNINVPTSGRTGANTWEDGSRRNLKAVEVSGMQATFVKLENVDLRENVLVQFSSDIEMRNVVDYTNDDAPIAGDTLHPVVLISTKGNPKTLFDFAYAAGKDVSMDADFKHGNRNYYGNSWHSDEDGQ